MARNTRKYSSENSSDKLIKNLLNEIRERWWETRRISRFVVTAFCRDKEESWLRCTYSTGKARGLPGSFREAAGNQLVDWPTWDPPTTFCNAMAYAAIMQLVLQLHNRSWCNMAWATTSGKLPCAFLFALGTLASHGTSVIRILLTFHAQFPTFTFAIVPPPI